MEASPDISDAIAPAPSDGSDETGAVTIKEKWRGAVTEGSGFVAVPVALLRLQSKYNRHAGANQPASALVGPRSGSLSAFYDHRKAYGR